MKEIKNILNRILIFHVVVWRILKMAKQINQLTHNIINLHHTYSPGA